MAYTPTTWVEGVTDLGPTNLNHLETGVQAAAATADSATTAAAAAQTTANAAIPKPGSPGTNRAVVWNGTTWDTATSITPAQLTAYPSDSTKYLNGGGTWTTPAAGSLVFIAADELVANATRDLSVTVPTNTYRSLLVKFKMRRNTTGQSQVGYQFNADTTAANYGGVDWRGDSATGNGAFTGSSVAPLGYCSGTDSRANCWLVGETTILDPNSTTDVKQVVSRSMFADTTAYYTASDAGVWLGTAAITTVRVPGPGAAWLSGTKLQVYGVV